MLNTGFKTFSTPDYKIGTAANTATVGLWDAVKTSSAQAWDFNPSSSLFRTFEMQEAMSVSDKVIPKAELNAKYAHLGLFFETYFYHNHHFVLRFRLRHHYLEIHCTFYPFDLILQLLLIKRLVDFFFL